MENEDYKKSNRELRISPKSGAPYWCDYCDRDKVHEGKKCGTCGKVNGVKRLKKDT